MPEEKPFSVPGDLVGYILLGPAVDQRQLQDSPVLGDVWLAYAADPNEPQDLLITPHREARASEVAGDLTARLRETGRSRPRPVSARVAYLQGVVAARLYFEELLRHLVPSTLWWQERKILEKLREVSPPAVRERIARILSPDAFEAKHPASSLSDRFTALDRYLALAGLLLWAGKPGRSQSQPRSATDLLKKAQGKGQDLLKPLLAVFDDIQKDTSAGRNARKLIFQISLNRPALPALQKSVPAVKADAARTLFSVSCEKITWAVVDSGIDENHVAFRTRDGKASRVKKTLDFTRIREIVSSDQDIDAASLAPLLEGLDLDKRTVRKILGEIAEDARNLHPVNWDLIERLITLTKPPDPRSVHGTHVAGIIGADRMGGGTEGPYEGGLCPDIGLYDCRVLAKTMEDTEFAIIAALQYIRHVNEQHNAIRIHGVNLSLQIPHNVRNYACGRTPICTESERLMSSGVVVVAAAGNRGYQSYQTAEGTYEGYAAFSITDPGNADEIITVGATHGNWPHTYGVSFFSSRGPTGDGRLKPDLVAPGERIRAPIPGNEWGEESGTSMAAPHVSGAAAMLLARYAELVGQPRRVKKILCESATDLGRERSFQGHGMLDVLRAFQSI